MSDGPSYPVITHHALVITSSVVRLSSRSLPVHLFVSPTTAGSGLFCISSVRHCWSQAPPTTCSSSHSLTRSPLVFISSRYRISIIRAFPSCVLSCVIVVHLAVFHRHRSPSCLIFLIVRRPFACSSEAIENCSWPSLFVLASSGENSSPSSFKLPREASKKPEQRLAIKEKRRIVLPCPLRQPEERAYW